MKHFVEARRDVIGALATPAVQPLVAKVCAVFDLRGKCRILAVPAAGQDLATVEAGLRVVFSAAAEMFWADEIWLDSGTTSPSRKAVYEAAWSQAVAEPPGQDRHFVLDRRLSKDAWFGSPFSPPWPLNEHTPPIISFFSFKGGVGRTTALVAVAVNLARAGRRPLVVDFDLESPGAGGLVLPVSGQSSTCGVVDFLLEQPLAPQGVLDVADYSHVCDDPRVIGDGREIVVVPAGQVDDAYLEKLGRVNYEFLYRTSSEPDAPASPLHDLLKMLRNRWAPDVVLIDSRAGLHDLGGLSLSGLAHWHVLFGLASEQSWSGLSIAVSHLGRQEVVAGRPQRDCTLVHALAPPPGAVRDAAVQGFQERAFELFSTAYFDPPDKPDAEWPVPDPEAADSPHYPFVLTWDSRVAGYTALSGVANYLCEGEHRGLANLLLDRTGRQPL